ALASLAQRRHSHVSRGGCRGLPHTLVVKEEKCLVLPDGPADGKSEIVSFQSCDRRVIRVEPIVGVGGGIAQEFVNAAMKLIGARAGNHVDDGSARKAHLGGEIGLLDFELFDRVNGRSIWHAEKAAV